MGLIIASNNPNDNRVSVIHVTNADRDKFLMIDALKAQRKILIDEVMSSIGAKEEYAFLTDVLDYAEHDIETHVGFGATMLDLIQLELEENYDINALYELLPETIQ